MRPRRTCGSWSSASDGEKLLFVRKWFNARPVVSRHAAWAVEELRLRTHEGVAMRRGTDRRHFERGHEARDDCCRDLSQTPHHGADVRRGHAYSGLEIRGRAQKEAPSTTRNDASSARCLGKVLTQVRCRTALGSPERYRQSSSNVPNHRWHARSVRRLRGERGRLSPIDQREGSKRLRSSRKLGSNHRNGPTEYGVSRLAVFTSTRANQAATRPRTSSG